MMKFDSLDKLCLHEIADLMSAEKQILKALPGIIKAVTSPELQEALQNHLKETEKQVDRLKETATLLGNSALRAKHCKGMEGLLEEGSEFIKEAEGDANIIDAGIVANCRRVEHYEIAAYNSLCSFLEVLGEEKAVKLMRQTHEEEKAADEKLIEIAEGFINLSTEPVSGGALKGILK